MALSVVNSGIVWATPVRPDLLGQHLEAYKKCKRTLHMLRLCHRFGKGPEVHITKLPIEIIDEISDVIFEHKLQQSWSVWLESFCHFEGRCEPIDHTECPGEAFPDCKEQMLDQLCDKCKAKDDHADCGNGCDNIVWNWMNEHLFETDDDLIERGEEEQADWEELINQKPGGNFAKFDKVCYSDHDDMERNRMQRLESLPTLFYLMENAKSAAEYC